MKCSACGRHITPRAKFCPYCGRSAAARQNQKAAAPAKSNWPLYITLVMAGIAIGAVAWRWIQEPNHSTPPAVNASTTAFDPTLYGEPLAKQFPAVYEVAAQFNCPCGDCNDGIEVCDCQMERGGAEVRQYIYELLQVHQPTHVIELVAQKYGHRKNGAAVPFKFESAAPPTWQAPATSATPDHTH